MAIDDLNVTPGELPAINEPPSWVEHLPAFVSEVIMNAGETGDGVLNFQARVLDARTRLLKQLVDALAQRGILLQGNLPSQAALDAIPTEGLPIGTAYFVDYAMRVWNGSAWGDSGSLRGADSTTPGPAGKNLNIIATLATVGMLNDITNPKDQDGYTIQDSGHLWMWLDPDGTGGEWTDLGLFRGESAYQQWLDAGNTGSVNDFLASLKISEVPNPETGKWYARQRVGNTSNTDWGALPAIIPDLTTKDGKQMVRVFETNGTTPVWKEVVAPVSDVSSVKEVVTTGELDLSIARAFSLDNRSVQRTVSIKAGTNLANDRCGTVVVFVRGNVGVNWPGNVDWNGGAYPLLGATKTLVTLTWDGLEQRWMGIQGATL